MTTVKQHLRTSIDFFIIRTKTAEGKQTSTSERVQETFWPRAVSFPRDLGAASRGMLKRRSRVGYRLSVLLPAKHAGDHPFLRPLCFDRTRQGRNESRKSSPYSSHGDHSSFCIVFIGIFETNHEGIVNQNKNELMMQCIVPPSAMKYPATTCYLL